ncbi:MAG: phosphoribosylformylglycinamidine synthase subunit PurS [Candidatus Woesearchaeota archaeon]
MHKIEVGYKHGITDAEGNSRLAEIRNFLGIDAKGVVTRKIYMLDADLSPQEIRYAADELFHDPIIQVVQADGSLPNGKFDYSILVSLMPGVTDNEGKTAKENLEMILGKPAGSVSTARQFLISGIDQKQANTIAKGLLANEVIQDTTIQDYQDLTANGLFVPSRKFPEHIPTTEIIDMEISDSELMEISSKRTLALNINEMKTLGSYVKRPEILLERRKVGLSDKLTDCELEAIAQTWSEHCKHKIFNGIIHYTDPEGKKQTIDSLFNTYVRKVTDQLDKPYVLSKFKDNAGVIRFNDRLAFVFKIETHNSPSALDPYGGAMTGIVGVNRDPFGTGKGAQPLFNVYGYLFGNPFAPISAGKLLHPRRIREGVHLGIIHGSNQSGIPLAWGFEFFDDRYAGKPLVYCGTGALMQLQILGKPSWEKKALVGDYIVMSGGKIGKDGIHGATFSSEELHQGSPVQAVQIGDPITQKRMTDFILRARDLGLYNAITDNGAGGLSSSVGEMAKDTNGCECHTDRAPLKYQGLDPWEILVSEAQERMTLAVPEHNLEEFLNLSKHMQVESTVLGQFTNTGKFHVKHNGKTVAYLNMDFLHEGDPRYVMEATFARKKYEEPQVKIQSHSETLKEMLQTLNSCSKEKKLRQYDHEVKGRSIIKPLVGNKYDVPSDATIILAEYGGIEGIVLSRGINPFYSDIDTYWMAASVIDEAVRRVVSTGGNPDFMAGLDNFCWNLFKKDTEEERMQKLGQLVRANQALYHVCLELGIPLISGKDSMYNSSRIGDQVIAIPPTLLFSVVSKIDDIRNAVTIDVKQPGDLVYIVGQTLPELGGSEFLRMYGHKLRGEGYVGNTAPVLNIISARESYQKMHEAINRHLIHSSHTPTMGGLGTALVWKCMAGELGMDIDLSKAPGSVKSDHEMFYSESNSRFIVTIDPANKARFENTVRGTQYALVGKVTDNDTLSIRGINGNYILENDVHELKEAWKSTMRMI